MRTFIIGICGIIGAGIGLLLDAAFWQGWPQIYTLTVAGLLVGLIGGMIVARLAYPKPKRSIDPSRYPNRLIQRR